MERREKSGECPKLKKCGSIDYNGTILYHKSMHNKAFQINLISEKEGGYTVTVPQLPGCISYGATVEDAKKNAQEAIALHLENVRGHSKRDLKSIFNRAVLSTVSVSPLHRRSMMAETTGMQNGKSLALGMRVFLLNGTQID